METHIHFDTKAGTIGGTFASILPVLHSEDVMRTIVLAAIGAAVSFSVSCLLSLIVKKRKK
jgi:hypothetical protein